MNEDKFSFEKVIYQSQVAKDQDRSDCEKCDFKPDKCWKLKRYGLMPNCVPRLREDKTRVIFKRVKQ